MKTIPLRTLVRDPIKVKAMTRKGQSVTVTDKGVPLWVLRPAGQPEEMDEETRARLIDEVLEETCREKVVRYSGAEIIEMSRR